MAALDLHWWVNNASVSPNQHSSGCGHTPIFRYFFRESFFVLRTSDPCLWSGGHVTSFSVPPDVCLQEGSVTNTHLERHITHPAELSDTAWWILVAGKAGVISEVALTWATFIKTSLQRKRMKLENRNERGIPVGPKASPKPEERGEQNK